MIKQLCVAKVIFSREFGRIWICPKPLLRSNVENTLVPAKESSASATKSTGNLSTLVTLLTLRKSTQNLYDPSFFTKTTGEVQGETDSWIIPFSSNSSIPSTRQSISFLTLGDTLYGLCLIGIASTVPMTCWRRDVLPKWSPGKAKTSRYLLNKFLNFTFS